jgi:hypothetical protein
MARKREMFDGRSLIFVVFAKMKLRGILDIYEFQRRRNVKDPPKRSL